MLVSVITLNVISFSLGIIFNCFGCFSIRSWRALHVTSRTSGFLSVSSSTNLGMVSSIGWGYFWDEIREYVKGEGGDG